MRVRGGGRGWRTLSRLALIGMIGGTAAACSTDASRLGEPFANPFSSEPAATGSLGAGDEAVQEAAPAIRTPRIQSQDLAAPGAAMSPRAAPSRVAASEPASGSVSGLNPDAGRPARNATAPAMTPRVSPSAPQPRLVFGQGPKGSEKKLDRTAEKAVEAKRAAEKATEKAAEAKKAAEKAAEAKKAAEKAAEARKHAKAETKIEPKADPKGKPDPKAERKAEAARKAEAEAKLAKADAAREAARKVAEAKAAEAAAKASAKASAKESAKETKQAAKEPAKEPEKAAPIKVASADPSAGIPAAASNESFRWPAKGRVITGYGSGGNEGINIAVPEGTPVKAAEEGTVAYAGSDVKGYGKLVLVRHSNGYVSAYAHNGELDVRPGDKVKRGQTIAKSGATGNVTSPQLHFEIRKGATPVDPIPHLAGN